MTKLLKKVGMTVFVLFVGFWGMVFAVVACAMLVDLINGAICDFTIENFHRNIECTSRFLTSRQREGIIVLFPVSFLCCAVPIAIAAKISEANRPKRSSG